ncbi:hypothetical protein [Bacillus thuringiensis]|uniref:hypothetical protein n=1 Tax=Bacillus thuringiensis TaxID=1428 RepID=UPI001BB0D74D|nr:hypothetical protein [Bacillus thuringiensis]MEB9561116.1 hypothetical protein [Bacillus cereus]
MTNAANTKLKLKLKLKRIRVLVWLVVKFSNRVIVELGGISRLVRLVSDPKIVKVSIKLLVEFEELHDYLYWNQNKLTHPNC